MAKASIVVDIARPPMEVFAFMADMGNMRVWTNMQRMDLNGPPAAGTTGSFDMPMMGRSRVFPFVITAFEEGRRWALTITSRLGLGFDYRLTPTATGTRLQQDVLVRPRGLLALVAPLIALMVRGEERGELLRLKAALEKGPSPG